MATNLTQTTFSSEYNDDYRDSDHYHRILFNNGRALQARELTQMQTIIQSEMARMGSFIFQDGGILGSGGSVSDAFAPVGYVKLVSFGDLGTDYPTLVGTKITSSVDQVTATVKAAIASTGGDPDTLLVSYISSNGLQSTDTNAAPRTFAAGDTLNYDTGSESGTLTVAANNQNDLAIGKGTMIEIPAFDTFVAGHFVTVEQQSLIISKYESEPTEVIGFKLTEDVVTISDDNALYDNSGSTPNLTSPGADRYRIRMTIAKESDITSSDTFYPLIKMIDGVVRRVNHGDGTLGELGNLLAARTYDINGDFVVANPGNEFDLTIQADSNDGFLKYNISGGIAFVNGKRVERSAAANPIRVQKPRSSARVNNVLEDLDEVTNQFISARYGNYVLADSGDIKGLIGGLDEFSTVNLYNRPNGPDATGNVDFLSVSSFLQKHAVGLSTPLKNVFETISPDSSDKVLGNIDGYGALTDDRFGVTFNDALVVQMYAAGDSSRIRSEYGDIAMDRIATLAANTELLDYYGLGTKGTARIRNIEEYDNEYRIHLFDVNLNSGISFRNIKSIGTATNNYANLKQVEGTVRLIDKEQSSLLFPIGRKRINSIQNLTMAVQRVVTDTTTVGGVASFEVSDLVSNRFTNGGDWILQVDSGGELYSPPSYDSASGNVTQISGLPASQAVTLLAYETKTGVQKQKRLQTSASESVSLTGRTFKLTKADIYLFRSVVEDATGLDITNRFIFDNGQRDNFYTVGQGTVKQGQTIPGGSVTVTYDYFTHTNGDYFAGIGSYPDIPYEKVPTYITSTGISHKLVDVIDMRPVKNNTGANFTGTGAVIEPLPKNATTMTATTVTNWQPRIDVVHMSPTGTIEVKTGVTSNSPQVPNIPPDHLKLHEVTLFPYVLNENDLTQRKINHRGFKMSDLRTMEQRITNVEELTALTIAEMELQKINVQDPNDATLPDRIKQGITGDTFNSNLQSHISDDDYRARIDKNLGIVGPLVYGRTLSLYFDSEVSDGVVQKGNTIWPAYTEEAYITQDVASKAINVNQFELNKNFGSGVIEPPRDPFTTRKKVDVNYELGTTAAVAEIGTKVVSSQGQENTDGGET